MEFSIHTFKVGKRDLLLQDHLVEGCDEVGVQESPVEDAETQASPDELEVVQVFGVNTRCRVNLQGVVVVGGVLEQTIEWVEHLMREQEEEFSAAPELVSTKTMTTAHVP